MIDFTIMMSIVAMHMYAHLIKYICPSGVSAHDHPGGRASTSSAEAKEAWRISCHDQYWNINDLCGVCVRDMQPMHALCVVN